MAKNDDSMVQVLWSLQIIAFIALFLFASGFFLSFPAYLFLIITEIAIIYCIIKKRKDIFLYLWQMQFFITIAFCIIERSDIFFNSRDVPYEIVWISLGLILIIEVVITLLFLYRERVIKKFLTGITLTTICIVILLMATICYEGVQIFGDVEPSSYLLSSDWRPSPSVPEHDNVVMTINSNIGFDVETIDNINIIANETQPLNITIINSKNIDDEIHLVYIASSGLIITTESNNSSVRLGPYSHVNQSVEVITSFIGNHSLTIVTESKYNGRTVERNVTFNCGIKDFNFKEPEALIHLYSESAVSAHVMLDGYHSDDTNMTVVIKMQFPDNFRSSIANINWNTTTEEGLLELGPRQSFSTEISLVMITFDEGHYQINVTAIDKESGLWLDQITYNFEYKMSKLVQLSDTEVYASSAIPGMTNVTIWGVTGENITLKVTSPEGYRVFWIDGINTHDLTNNKTKVYLTTVPRTITLQFVAPSDDVNNGTVLISSELRAGTTSYGILPAIFGTVITVLLALLIAVPLSLATAIFLSRYCSSRIKVPIKSALELIAGIPSVIIGLWAFYTFGPLLESSIYPILTGTVGQVVPFLYTGDPTSRCLMTAGVILGFMIFPIVTTLAEDAISAVDDEVVNASLGMGATKWQTMKNVVLVKSRSGWLSAILLGTGRAIGETMAVLMVMGAVMIIPSTLMAPGATMTSLIAGNFTVLSNLDVPRHALLGIALILFLMVFTLDVILIYIKYHKYRSDGLWQRMKSKTSLLMGKVTGPIVQMVRPGSKQESTFLDSKVQIRREKAVYALMVLSVLGALSILIYIITFIIMKGGNSIELSFFMEREMLAGREGGFLNAIIGSLSLIAIALLFAVPLSLGTAIYISEYSKERSKLGISIEIAVTMLSSTPSIIYGAFGFILFVLFLNFGFSLIAGGITLGIMILPIMIAASTEALKSVPRDLRNASYALGVTDWKTITNITLPAATPAITSGLILSMGRAIGETAAVLITAGYSALIVSSIMDPAASLPNMIYQYYDLAIKYPSVGAKVYSVAMVLILIILSLNITAKVISYLYRKKLYGT